MIFHNHLHATVLLDFEFYLLTRQIIFRYCTKVLYHRFATLYMPDKICIASDHAQSSISDFYMAFNIDTRHCCVVQL